MITSSSKCTRLNVLAKLIFSSRYTAAVVLNSVYDYDAASPKDDLVDIAAKVLRIAIPALRPDIAVIVGAFPFRESIKSFVSCSITR